MDLQKPKFITENKSSFRIYFKAIFIAFMSIILLVPISSIESTISNRSYLRNQVVRDIAQSSTGAQTIAGPIIVVPYEVTYTRKKYDHDAQKHVYENYTVDKTEYFLPEELELNGDTTMQERYRGIYKAHIFNWNGVIKGHFKMPENFGVDEGDNPVKWKTPYLSLGIKDTRGIISKPKLSFAEQQVSFEAGPKYAGLKSGIHAPLSLSAANMSQSIPFSISLVLQGLQNFQIIPMGKTTTLSMKSDWPHPSFNGNQLPMERKISDSGFSANWQTTWFANNIGSQFYDEVNSKDILNSLERKAFGVKFIDAVDVYQKSERSAKYGFLFIGLTFAAFFLFEVINQLKIHPVQYGFVGLSLAMFFLLEFSLSEHMTFGLAYLIASISCIFILGYYLSYAVKNKIWGISFAVMLGTLYAALYGLLICEDLALVLGSLMLFLILSVAMILTRKIDWYQVTKQEKVRKGINDHNMGQGEFIES